MHFLNLIIRQYWINQIEGILQNKWPVFFKSINVKVIGKQTKATCQRLIGLSNFGGDYGDVTTKCTVGIKKKKKKKDLSGKTGKSQIY